MGLIDKTLIISSYVVRRCFSLGDSFCDVMSLQTIEQDDGPLRDRFKVRERYDKVSRGALSFGLMECSFRAYKDYLREYDRGLLIDADSL